ncbi:MAG: low molecular weight phosphatase family protein [Candidatus Parvarchaeum sp.]
MSLVLFICKYNNGRSQIAEALFNNLTKKHKAVSAAGNSVGEGIDAINIKLMKTKFGIDLSSQHPKLPTQSLLKSADKIIIVCDPKDCILIPEDYIWKAEHWYIPELEGRSEEERLKIIEDISAKVKELILRLDKKGQ